MKFIPAVILIFVSSFLWGQSTQYLETYDLQSNPGTRFLAQYALDAALSGNLATFSIDSGKVVQLSRKAMLGKLVTQWATVYDDWKPKTDYYTGDRVTYDSITWEAILDNPSTPPEENDFWMKARNENMYYHPRDLSMQLQYNWVGKKRVNQWVHFISTSESNLAGVLQYIFSFKFEDFDKIVNQTPFMIYQPNAPTLGWVNESVFYFEDAYYQKKLLSELCKYAYQNPKESRVYLSQDSLLIWFKRDLQEVKDVFDEENFPYKTVMEMTWKNNSVDSIRLHYVVDDLGGKYRRIVEVPFKKFLTKVSPNKKLKFSGFQTFSAAITNRILRPTDIDTLSNDITPQSTSTNPIPTVSGAKTFTTSQQIQYSLKSKGNLGLLKEGDEFGKYIRNAITSGKFKSAYKAFSNDSLRSQVSDEEVRTRIITRPAPEFAPWDLGAQYINDDMVTYKNGQYKCLADNVNIAPDSNRDIWELVHIHDALYEPRDFNRFYINYQLVLNEKCEIKNRYPTAITLYVEDLETMMFRPVMTLDIETLKKILLDTSVGSSGTAYWNIIEKGMLTGFLSTNGAIRKQ